MYSLVACHGYSCMPGEVESAPAGIRHTQCSYPGVTAVGVAMWWCKRWLSRKKERALQTQSPLVDIESTSLRIRTTTAITRIDRHVTKNHHTEPTLLVSTYEW